MPVILPDKPIAKTLFSPKVILFYGMPKIGKSKIATDLPKEKNLILEGDPRGVEMYDCMWLPLHTYTYTEYYDVINQIIEVGNQRYAAGERDTQALYLYRYITIDNVTTIQEIARASLTKEYLDNAKRTVLADRSKTQKDALADPMFQIADLPYAAGTHLLRERVKRMIEDMAAVCHKLIIIGHVKDKEITTMANELVKVNEIALDGKLGEIVASRIDAIAYMYRKKADPKDPKSPSLLMVNFDSNEKTTMGSRFRYLAGKQFEFSWEKIFPDEYGLPIPEN